MVPGIQMNLFETGMEDHHNVADLFHLVSNSRQVGVWKYGIALCRWVLHSFGYSDFHHQWCLWWEVTTVLPAIGILKAFAHQDEANGKFRHQWFGDDQVCLLQALLGSLTRFAHQSGANENISSPMVWWLQCFATFSWRSKLEEYLYRSLDFVVLAGKEFDDMRHRLWVSRTLQWRLWRFRWVWVMFYHRFVCWKDKWCEFGHFSDETLVLHAWKQVLNQWVFLKQIENKQPVQTSFRCVFAEIAVFS